jgi:hypothetical protein
VTESIGVPRFISVNPVEACIRLTARGWDEVCAVRACTTEDTEPYIAGCLFLEMQKLQYSFSLLVVDEGTQRGPDDTVEPSGFIDYKFYYTLAADDFIGMECKRISGAAKDKRLASEYVIEGVERYSSAKYCVGHKIGIMLGFVIDGTEKSARRMVCNALSKRTIQCAMLGNWRASTRFDHLWPTGGVSATDHIQHRTTVTMEILHIFAEFP